MFSKTAYHLNTSLVCIATLKTIVKKPIVRWTEKLTFAVRHLPGITALYKDDGRHGNTTAIPTDLNIGMFVIKINNMKYIKNVAFNAWHSGQSSQQTTFYYAPNFKVGGGGGHIASGSSVRPSVRSSRFLMNSITLEPWMLLFWNFIYGFLMKK